MRPLDNDNYAADNFAANGTSKKVAVTWFYDRWILVLALLLIAFGLLMVASASMEISDREYHFPLHYFIRQFFFICIGLVLGWYTTRVPMRSWQKLSPYLILLSLFLLLVVLIPGIGHVINGSRRWIPLGFVSLQVSEMVKIGAILYLAGYLQKYQIQVQTKLIGFIKPMLLLGLIVILLLMEPDFGAAFVITMTFLALLFVANVRIWPFSILFILVAAAMVALVIFSPYRFERLITFMNPWQNAYGSGYQLTQSLIAFGRGGLWGVGLGNSIQKLFYLPEAHTDFIFAVIGEEMGLVGELLLIGLYIALLGRIVKVGLLAQKERDLFSMYTAFGISLWLGLQAMINMCVNTGILPTKGLTLPFISYGGSSMLINCVVMGIALRIAFEAQRLKSNKITK